MNQLLDKSSLIRIECICCFFFMKDYLKQPSDRAWGRSIIISSLLLIYFVVFGYDFPPKEVQSKYI